MMIKKGKIDRFVADLRSRSSKNGKSLVVQTGFPTSLIDLFVKNRSRLKKPSKKNKDYCLLFGDDLDSMRSKRILPPLDSKRSLLLASPQITRNHLIGSDDVVVGGEDEVRISNDCLFGFAMKMFLMLVLIIALSMKLFKFGIVVSAFTLLIVELCCVHLYCGLRRLWYSNRSLNCVGENVVVSAQLGERNDNCFIAIKSNDNCMIAIKKREENNNNCLIVTKNSAMGSSSCIINTHDDLINEIQMIDPIPYNVLSFDEMRGVLEKDGDIVVEAAKIKNPKSSSSAKIKAKQLKKYVIKRFSSKKKGKKSNVECNPELSGGSLTSTDISVRSDGSETGETTGAGEDYGEEDEDEDDRIVLEDNEDGKVNQKQEDVDEACSRSSDASEGSVNSGPEQLPMKKSLVHMVPFMVILAGLLGNRVVALALTVGWFLFILSVQTARRYSNKTQCR